jgi:hypothetical protein
VVCCQFLLKTNRLFLIRDAKFKMNQIKNPSKSKFSTSSLSGETENKLILISILKNNTNYNNFKENYWKKFVVSELCLL